MAGHAVLAHHAAQRSSRPKAAQLHLLALPLLLLAASFAPTAFAAAGVTAEVVYEWVSVEYDFTDAPLTREQYIAAGLYIPDNCVITGIKLYGDDMFLTVPRWFPGVPSTLNKVVMVGGQPLLTAWPSWAAQNATRLDTLWYVQSMEIDPATQIMWVIDAGRQNIFRGTPVNGPPKLLLYDTPSGTLLHTFVFDNAVASYTASFLNDIVVDRTRQVAYISDTGTGAVITYHRATNTATRYSSAYTEPDPAGLIRINGISYPTIKTPCDSIALDPVADTVYFAPLTTTRLYAVSGAVLRDASLTNSDITAKVQNLGHKAPSDGMAFSSNGKLYYGDLNADCVYEWDIAAGAYGSPASTKILVQNNVTMQWQDTFAFDDKGNLYFTSNRLQLIFTSTMNFSDPTNYNMRVFRVPINGDSYLSLEPPAPPSPAGTCSSCSGTYTKGDLAGGIIGGLVLGAILVAVGGYFALARGGSAINGRQRVASGGFDSPYTPFEE